MENLNSFFHHQDLYVQDFKIHILSWIKIYACKVSEKHVHRFGLAGGTNTWTGRHLLLLNGYVGYLIMMDLILSASVPVCLG